MKERIKAKDSLLEECEKEIMKIRKQYEIIDQAVGKGTGKRDADRKGNFIESHGLLKERKNRA